MKLSLFVFVLIVCLFLLRRAARKRHARGAWPRRLAISWQPGWVIAPREPPSGALREPPAALRRQAPAVTPERQVQAKRPFPLWVEPPPPSPSVVQRRKEPRFELVPHQMGSINARAVLPDEVWRQISRKVRTSDGERCCECPCVTGLECHEVWEYKWSPRVSGPKKVGVMRLTGLRTLCHLCHMGKHIKFAQSQGKLPQVEEHLMKLYGVSEARLKQLEREAAQGRYLKYRYEELDLTYLNEERFIWVHERIGRKFSANEMPELRN